MLLLNIGFQLSYLALLGIVFFQPYLYRALYFRPKWLDYLWKLSSVALAAQLTTLPISLFYFHQFPVYFLLSGLIVVPAAMAILSVGMSLFVLAGVPFLGTLLGKLLFLIIKTMNAVIFFLENLPYSTLSDIWLGIEGMGIHFLLVFLLAVALLAPSKSMVYAVLGMVALVCAQVSWQSWQRFNHREIVIYQVRDQTVVDCISGRRCLRIIDSSKTEKDRAWATDNYLSYRGIKEVKTVHWQDSSSSSEWHFQGGFLQFQDFKMAMLHELPKDLAFAPVFDLVLLHSNPRFELPDLQGRLPSQQLAWDGSSAYYRAKEWKEECATLGIAGYDVRAEGALVIELGR